MSSSNDQRLIELLERHLEKSLELAQHLQKENQELSETIARLDTSVKQLRKQTGKLINQMDGNGKDGVISRLSVIESCGNKKIKRSKSDTVAIWSSLIAALTAIIVASMS